MGGVGGQSTSSSQWGAALEALRSGQCVAVLDGEDREGETDLFFPAASLSPASLRFLRTQAGGELYISVGHEVASAFGLPFIGEVLAHPEVTARFPVFTHMGKARGGAMCQGSCSVGLSLDHRRTKTGAPDVERSFTCRRLAELFQEVTAATPHDDVAKRIGDEFHTPGHIFLCVENPSGLKTRTGHTELSVALARAANVTPVMVGCVMLCNEGDDFGALPPAAARTWAAQLNIPFITGVDIIAAVNLATS